MADLKKLKLMREATEMRVRVSESSMLFDDKKLETADIVNLLQCPIASVEAYALMLAPVYVLMKLNQKLVSVKAPLDFFVPDELERLRRYETFYLPKFTKSSARFQTAAKLLLNLIDPPANTSALQPASYELAHEALKMLAPCWGYSLKVENFFTAVFADELCGALPADLMMKAREKTVIRHDNGILISGMTIFLMLHLGYFDLNFLKQVRQQIYLETVERDEAWSTPISEWQSIARDLKIAFESSPAVDRLVLGYSKTEWAKKVLTRLEHIQSLAQLKNYPSLSIHDEGGFAA